MSDTKRWWEVFQGRCILLFHAPYCAPCAEMKVRLERFSNDSSVPFDTVDCEDYPELAADFGVRAVPTLMLIDWTGQEIRRLVGSQPQKAIDAMFAEVTG